MRALEDLHFRSRVRDGESVDKAVESSNIFLLY